MKKRLSKTRNRKYRPSEKQKPAPTVARTNKRPASRFCQLKTGHCLTGQHLQWTTRRPPSAGGASTRSRLASTCSKTARSGKVSRRPSVLEETRRLPDPDRTKIAELLADDRRSQAILDFLATTDVGRTAGRRRRSSGQRGLGVEEQGNAREEEDPLRGMV